MKYIAVFDDSFLSNFRLDDEDKLTLVLTDKNNGTRAVRLKPVIRPTITSENGESLYLMPEQIDVLLNYERQELAKKVIDNIMGRTEEL